MNIKTVQHLIMQGKEFVYSAEYGNLENFSIDSEVDRFEILSDDVHHQLTRMFRISAILRGLIRGEQTDVGYVVSVERFKMKPMSAREWFEVQFGEVNHGTSQFKLMDDYARYYSEIKMGRDGKDN